MKSQHNCIPVMWPGILSIIGYPSETGLNLKCCDVSFTHNLFRSCLIVSKFCTAHGDDTTVLCAQYLNAWTDWTCVKDERAFAGFEFKMNFGCVSYIAKTPCCVLCLFVKYVGHKTKIIHFVPCESRSLCTKQLEVCVKVPSRCKYFILTA